MLALRCVSVFRQVDCDVVKVLMQRPQLLLIHRGQRVKSEKPQDKLERILLLH